MDIAKPGGSNADSRRQMSGDGGDDDKDISRSVKKEKIEPSPEPLIGRRNEVAKGKGQDGGAPDPDQTSSREAAHFLSIFPEEVFKLDLPHKLYLKLTN